MRVNFGKLTEMQKSTARQVSTEDAIKPENIRYIAGFDVAYLENKAVCAAIVVDFKTLEVVERKHCVVKSPMNYVPGFLAFREGPPIMQAYFDLEHEPDVLLIDGHGIAHPLKCGLATFVGVELEKPTIGIAKKRLVGEEQGEKLLVEGEERACLLRTRAHAKPIYVSPGYKVSVETATEIVKHCIVPPHKMPEPLHLAHRHAAKILERLRNPEKEEKEKAEN